MSDSLQPHRLQHARLPCPSPTPQIHVHLVGDATPPSHPLLSPSPPAFNLSQHQIFSKESVLCIRWPKYWSFSFSSSPSNEYSGLISFRIDWFDLLAVQGTLKSLLKHHSLKASILHLPPNYLNNIPWLFIVCYQASLSMGVLQARILEWVAMLASMGSSQIRDKTQVSCIAGKFFTS